MEGPFVCSGKYESMECDNCCIEQSYESVGTREDLMKKCKRDCLQKSDCVAYHIQLREGEFLCGIYTKCGGAIPRSGKVADLCARNKSI